MDSKIPKERKSKLDSLFEAFSVIAEGAYVYVCDMKYDYSRWSKTAVDVFGLPSEYMIAAGDIWEEHIHPQDRETYHSKVANIFAGKAFGHDMQYRACRPNGEYDVCTCKGIVLKVEDESPEYFCGVIRNHGAQGALDSLTGLPNQYRFFEDLQADIRTQTKARIVMVGISRFTEINEVYGYHFGNRVLQNFGRYLVESVGKLGSVYRLDGTRFAVISTSFETEEIKRYYEKLRSYYRMGVNIDDKQIILELNCGLLAIDNFNVDDQTVYACLNFAYGESKVRKQGDLVEFYNNLTDENRQRIEKLHAIRASIMREYEGFYLLYQPVVDAKSENLIGAEALLRWRSEEYGMVPPDHFIPLLERDPLFPELGQWILWTALQAAKMILKKYPDFMINVNLSYTQLEKPDFVEMVLMMLEQTEFPASHLCLEITERCRLLDMDLLKNIVVNLRGHGIRIALDDFGTGFSSIGLVKNLPFDTIKIDRSFVLKIEDDCKERELIEHFTNVASTFGAKVCVEGIETPGMRDILQKYRVQSFQGYYYAKPLEIEEFLSRFGISNESEAGQDK
ncbi:MAG: EAL domain-containing protein [Lachnospiraceae bacterium]|jgi:diguanylate cyclase (GGDEF)-like protein|nr:EAL domain-containing protein [Lachnospiraceae bacterium]